MKHFGTSARRRRGSTKTRRTLERILRWRCWRFASFGVSLAETTTAPTIVNKDIPSSVSKFLLKHPLHATPSAVARHQNQGFRVWPRHPMPCDGALPPPSSTRARTTPTADSAAIKIIPSSPRFKSPNSSRHRRHPCPTSHPVETSSNARGAHPPREDEDEDEDDACWSRRAIRTSGGRLTRSTRVDGNVHARAQRGGAGGGHGKHPSFGARLRVEDATGGRNALVVLTRSLSFVLYDTLTCVL
jgi:hypothetical protein